MLLIKLFANWAVHSIHFVLYMLGNRNFVINKLQVYKMIDAFFGTILE